MPSDRTKFVRGFVPIALVMTLCPQWDPSMPEMIERAPQVVAGAVADLSAPEILAKMAAVCAGCSSYQDEGVLWDDFRGFFGHESSLPFATSFVRGVGFRFEYRRDRPKSLLDRFEEDERRIIWGDERRARRWTTDGDACEDTLDLQLAGEAGVSALASKNIPRLLLPEILGGRRIGELVDPIVVAIDALDGRNCFRIEAGQSGWRETIWIDTESFLVRRMQDVDELGDGGQCVSTTAYAPRLNVEIDPVVFAFEPRTRAWYCAASTRLSGPDTSPRRRCPFASAPAPVDGSSRCGLVVPIRRQSQRATSGSEIATPSLPSLDEWRKVESLTCPFPA